MKSLLMKCQGCTIYTMNTACPKCRETTKTAHPPRYSPDDRYARYRSPLAYQEEPRLLDRSG